MRQLVVLTDPLRVVVFGSWARGQHGPDSDVDIAVIVDSQSDLSAGRFLRSKVHGVHMPMDLLTIPLERYERFCHSVNSVHYDIANEGVVFYERSVHGPASRSAAA